MSTRLDGGVSAGDRHPFICPQCYQVVMLSIPALVPTPCGHLAVDADKMAAALGLHMRVGCTAG